MHPEAYLAASGLPHDLLNLQVRNACIRQVTLCKFAAGLGGLVAVRTHVARVGTSLATPSLVADNCNSTLVCAARSQEMT